MRTSIAKILCTISALMLLVKVFGFVPSIPVNSNPGAKEVSKVHQHDGTHPSSANLILLSESSSQEENETETTYLADLALSYIFQLGNVSLRELYFAAALFRGPATSFPLYIKYCTYLI